MKTKWKYREKKKLVFVFSMLDNEQHVKQPTLAGLYVKFRGRYIRNRRHHYNKSVCSKVVTANIWCTAHDFRETM